MRLPKEVGLDGEGIVYQVISLEFNSQVTQLGT